MAYCDGVSRRRHHSDGQLAAKYATLCIMKIVPALAWTLRPTRPSRSTRGCCRCSLRSTTAGRSPPQSRLAGSPIAPPGACCATTRRGCALRWSSSSAVAAPGSRPRARRSSPRTTLGRAASRGCCLRSGSRSGRRRSPASRRAGCSESPSPQATTSPSRRCAMRCPARPRSSWTSRSWGACMRSPNSQQAGSKSPGFTSRSARRRTCLRPFGRCCARVATG